jgi:hypothetical protein
LWGRVAAIDNQQRGEWCYVGGELSERDSLSAGAAGRVDAVVVGSCGRRVGASCVDKDVKGSRSTEVVARHELGESALGLVWLGPAGPRRDHDFGHVPRWMR